MSYDFEDNLLLQSEKSVNWHLDLERLYRIKILLNIYTMNLECFKMQLVRLDLQSTELQCRLKHSYILTASKKTFFGYRCHLAWILPIIRITRVCLHHKPRADLAAYVGFRLKASSRSCISVSKSVECVPLLGLKVSKNETFHAELVQC
jgi:hypothetical protein